MIPKGTYCVLVSNVDDPNSPKTYVRLQDDYDPSADKMTKVSFIQPGNPKIQVGFLGRWHSPNLREISDEDGLLMCMTLDL